MASTLPVEAKGAHWNKALTLARRGRFREAEGLLATCGGEKAAIETLDLRARMAAQQGQLVAAEQLWLSVLARDLSHEGALAGLAAVRARQTRRSIAPLLTWFLIPLSLLAIWTAVTFKQIERRWRQELSAAQQADLSRLDQLGVSLTERLDLLQRTQQSLTDTTIGIESGLTKYYPYQDQANQAVQEKFTELHRMVDQVKAEVANQHFTWPAPPKRLETR